MRGNPQTIAARRVIVDSSRRSASWIAQASRDRHRKRAERLEIIERLARDERRALQSGPYVPELKYRVRP